jgi:hypothetical protein
MKFSTGEDWNGFMYEFALTQEQSKERGYECVKTQNFAAYKAANYVTKGCGTGISYFYFIFFTVLVSMLIMNLSVAAVIEGLNTAKQENMGVVQGDEIEILIDKW